MGTIFCPSPCSQSFVAMSHNESCMDQWPPCSTAFGIFYIAGMKQAMSRITVTNLELFISTPVVDEFLLCRPFEFQHRGCLHNHFLLWSGGLDIYANKLNTSNHQLSLSLDSVVTYHDLDPISLNFWLLSGITFTISVWPWTKLVHLRRELVESVIVDVFPGSSDVEWFELNLIDDSGIELTGKNVKDAGLHHGDCILIVIDRDACPPLCSSSDCDSDVDDEEHLIIATTQRAQDARVGYSCDYQNKRNPLCIHEVKEFQ